MAGNLHEQFFCANNCKPPPTTVNPRQPKRKSGSAFISRILFSPALADRERGHLSGGSCDPAPACAGCNYYPESYSLARERAGRPFPCYVLHRMGFIVPPSLRSERWALTPPFHPCPSSISNLAIRDFKRAVCFSVTLSVAPAFAKDPRGLRPACCPVVSGLSSRPHPAERDRRATTPADPL